jgi:hypothetical protein
MPHYSRRLGAFVVVVFLGLPSALAAGGAWTFEIDERDHPGLSYSDVNNKTVFLVGCGHAFAIHAVYPGAPKKDGEKVTIAIASGKQQMSFAGEIASGYEDDPPNTTHFLQWDLGYRRQDPALYEKKWHQLENRLFDLLDSGRPLTVAAEGKSYVLQAVDAPRWRQRFQKIC